MNVLAISGSLRLGASNTSLLDAAARVAPQGMVVTRYPSIAVLPHFNPDDDTFDQSTLPEVVTRFRRLIGDADALLLSTPEYAHGLPGSFKNALDWLHLPSGTVYLADKVIGLISVAGGTQGLQAINTMEFCVRALRGWAVPLVVTVPAGQVQSESVERQLKMLGSEVVRVADHFHVTESPDHAAECTKAGERIAAAA